MFGRGRRVERGSASCGGGAGAARVEGLGARAGIAASLVREAAGRVESSRPRLAKLWRYYRNPARAGGDAGAVGASGPLRLGQEEGLPGRVTGRHGAALVDDRVSMRREVVIENDIQWRVHAMVDFLFGKGVQIVSRAPDERTRGLVEHLLDLVIERSGGRELLHSCALMGHVYGHVDLVVRVDAAGLRRAAGERDERARIDAAADAVSIDVVEARRGAAVLDPHDYRRVVGYVLFGGDGEAAPVEVFGPSGRAWWDGEQEGHEPGVLLGDRVPVVHIQNVMQPLRYSGIGEVEPLIPLQDELNTRLSDRANRVALQSFKMYFAKGIEGFELMGIGPGQVFSSDHPDASIESFGGDGSSPSEDRHISEVRQALDKLSGVPPIASGVVEARIGNLTSANALRVTMVGLLTRTQRKRVTYGAGLERVCGLVLDAAASAGVLDLAAGSRRVGLEWPDPLPIDEHDLVQATRAKRLLGVPDERILEELGYVPQGAADGSEQVSVRERRAGEVNRED